MTACETPRTSNTCSQRGSACATGGASSCGDIAAARTDSGYADWRVPTIDEMLGIAAAGGFVPAIGFKLDIKYENATYLASSTPGCYFARGQNGKICDATFGPVAPTNLVLVRAWK